MSSEEEQLETRYRDLLQPIKELAGNWDIDIAHGLTEYLEELESLRVTLDGGKSSLNFAEAALLIQGSTAIYSKKVEYLHQLVLQALELITRQKKSVDTKDGGAGSGVGDEVSGPSKSQRDRSKVNTFDDDRFLFGSDPEYLLLDDYVEEAHNIDLVSDSKKNAKTNGFLHPSSSACAHASQMMISSLMAEDHGSSGGLRMTSCTMNINGALVIGGLPQINMGLVMGGYGSLRAPAEESRIDGAHAESFTFTGGDHHIPINSNRMELAEAFPGFNCGDVDFGVGGGGADNDHDDHDDYNGGGGDYYAGVDDFEGQTGVSGAVSGAGPSTGGSYSPVRAGALFPDKVAILAAAGNSDDGKAAAGAGVSALSLMDPHEKVAGSKPIRRGRTYRLPSSLNIGAGGQGASSSSGSSSSNTAPSSSSARRSAFGMARLLAGDVPARGVLHEFLLPVLKAQRRARIAQVRKAGVGAARADRFFYRASGETETEYPPARGKLDAVGDDALYDDDDEDDNGGYVAFYGDDEVGAPGMGFEQDGYGGDYRVGDDDSPVEMSTYEPLLEEEDHLRLRMEKVLDEGLNRGPSAYEVLCRRHIEAFMHGADQFARETQLSKRVSEWTRRLEPLLQAQEEEPEFDIHEYSDRLLSDVSSLTRHLPQQEQQEQHKEDKDHPQRINFYEAAHGKSAQEVSRLFLACLQLANAGNVVVVQPAPYLGAGKAQPKAGVKAPLGSGRAGGGRRAVVADAENIAPQPQPQAQSQSQFQSQSQGHVQQEDATQKAALLSAKEYVNAGFDLRLINATRKVLNFV